MKHPYSEDSQETLNRESDTSPHKYTCSEYREEMILLALQKKLQKASTEEERRKIQKDISRLEQQMGL